MPLTPGWQEIAVRLAISLLAGALIGINRGEHARAAGLRTTILVCLAAAVAMLQANLLLPTAGKAAGSFATMDMMRLPLGILTGIGFIGGGVILHRSGLVVGVTAATSLWAATMIGLCFGGGQLGLGGAATTLVLAVLWPLRWLEARWQRDRTATLLLVAGAGPLTGEAIRQRLTDAGPRVTRESVSYADAARRREWRFDLRWRAVASTTQPPACIAELATQDGVERLEWMPGRSM